MKYTFRLKSNKDFVSIYKKGKFIVGRNCVLYYRKNGRKFNRFGISVGKKVGCAVLRNRAKRVIRQAYRENEEMFPIGYDLVVTARAGAAQCKSYHISSFFKKRVIPAVNGKA